MEKRQLDLCRYRLDKAKDDLGEKKRCQTEKENKENQPGQVPKGTWPGWEFLLQLITILR